MQPKISCKANGTNSKARHVNSGPNYDDDLAQVSGKSEELAGVLQQRYGYGKAQAELEINKWITKHDPRTKK